MAIKAQGHILKPGKAKQVSVWSERKYATMILRPFNCMKAWEKVVFSHNNKMTGFDTHMYHYHPKQKQNNHRKLVTTFKYLILNFFFNFVNFF